MSFSNLYLRCLIWIHFEKVTKSWFVYLGHLLFHLQGFKVTPRQMLSNCLQERQNSYPYQVLIWDASRWKTEEGSFIP